MKIWLVGAGYWGSKVKSELDNIPGVTEVEVLDIKNGKSIQDINTIDPVILATPLWNHYEQTLELLKRGHDVYVEKPLAQTVDEITHIKKHLNSTTVLMVGHIFLYNPLLQQLKTIIDTGKLGKITHVESRRLNWGIRQTQTTPLLSLAPHDVSIVDYLIGCKDVTHAKGVNLSNNTVPDMVEFGNAEYTIKVSWWWPKRERCVIVIGDQGQAVWDEDDRELRIYDGHMETKYPNNIQCTEKTAYSEPSVLHRELKHFVDCCITRSKPVSDINNALQIASILDQAEHLLSK